MRDFFISYNAHDRSWAVWIAWQLEEHGFSVTIQAWDFVGNWVIKMDRAMQKSQRTVAVLSPHYVKAMFTQSEWANAFRLDPTGEQDLLIPVLVAPVELEGTLAQIAYVDFVGCTEDEAEEMLLKRVRGERGKPATSPKFPGGQHSSEGARERSIKQKPVYPATGEDEAKLLRVRDIVVHWRGQYVAKVESLRVASERARALSREPPDRFDDDVIQVIALAGAVAHDLQSLALHELEFATSYGLMMHPAVFSGSAISQALRYASWASPESRALLELAREEGEVAGLRTEDLVPDSYGFEMLARTLEAGLELARFDIGALPRGYLVKSAQVVPDNLLTYRRLFVASIDSDPGLHLMTADSGVEQVGSFVARKLPLRALCAQRNREGSFDLVASDANHLYYWQASSSLPTMQFPLRARILSARFLASAPGSPVAVFDRQGAVTVITAEGGYTTVTIQHPPDGHSWSEAQIWVDPLDKDAWYVVAWTTEHAVTSGLHGSLSCTKFREDLFNDPVFISEFHGRIHYWYDAGSLTLGTLDSLPCVIVERQAYWGSAVCFLDPKTLVAIRPPLVIRGALQSMTLAVGRWLVVGFQQRGGKVRNRIAVLDLDSQNEEPIGSWLEGRGDVYNPIAIAENDNSFQTLQVFRNSELPLGERYQLSSFEWPAGHVEVLKRFSDLSIRHVEDAVILGNEFGQG
jgi:hypothetical protein